METALQLPDASQVQHGPSHLIDGRYIAAGFNNL
jgi:hypothetical protein